MTFDRLTRRQSLTLGGGLTAACLTGLSRTGIAGTELARTDLARADDWKALAQDVRAEFRWAWQNYRKRAWGKDEINPVSGTAQTFLIKGHDVALSLVEALDTLWVMELDAEFFEAVNWVKSHLDFNINAECQLFETNIRMLGGLLSAYLACGDAVLLAKAKDLAGRLMKAFEASPFGLPYRYVNLRTGAVRDPETNLAEIGTYALEFGTLGRLTGDKRYYETAKRALKHALAKRSSIGLMAANIHAETGEFTSRNASVDVYADSFYEYLWYSWELFGDAEMKAAAQQVLTAIVQHQGRRYEGFLWFPTVDYETGEPTGTSQTELGCYLAGLFGRAGLKSAGDDFLASYTQVQDELMLIPEVINVTSRKPFNSAAELRPEYPDACLKLWLGDQDKRYRRLAAMHFTLMKAANRAAYGYTVIKDITKRPMIKGDNCPSYWWAEQMKYYYLLFSDSRRVDYRQLVLSTQGKVLRGFKRSV